MKMKFKLRMNEDLDPKTAEVIRAYRDYALMDDDDAITKENIDGWALNETARNYNWKISTLKETLLKEGTTVAQAAKDLDAEEVTTTQDKNQIEKVLDRSLKKALRMRGAEEDFPNVLLIGEAGTGKTSMVMQWAKENNINLYKVNLGTAGPEAFAGIVARDPDDPRYATRLGTNEMIKMLSKPRSVLFLDEYNRAKTEVRGAVLTLVQNHVVWDPNEESGEKYLDNFLFTIAAINPSGSVYKGAKELDPAELSRFYTLAIEMVPSEQLRYLKKWYGKELAKEEDAEERLALEGRLKLAETILSAPEFSYDTSKEIEENFEDPNWRPLNYRSFKQALDFSDGTKENFLDVWRHYCNYKKKGTIETILSDYVDVDDKANQAISGETESEVFGKRQSNAAKLKALHPELNV